jgi:hypothetical protein
MPDDHRWCGDFVLPENESRMTLIASIRTYLQDVTNKKGITFEVEEGVKSPLDLYVRPTSFQGDIDDTIPVLVNVYAGITSIINNLRHPRQKSVWQWLRENPYK